MSSCNFCKETNCIASSKANILGHDVFVAIRMDMEFNQIDAEFGIIYGENDVRAEWSDALDINFCPVCGRELPKSEFDKMWDVAKDMGMSESEVWAAIEHREKCLTN